MKSGTPFIFQIEGRDFAVVLGLSEVAVIEKTMQTPFDGVLGMMRQGFTSALTCVFETVARERTDVGWQPVPLDRMMAVIGALEPEAPRPPEAPKDWEPPPRRSLFAIALGEAVTALGNGLGLRAEPSPTPLPNGSGSASTRKRS